MKKLMFVVLAVITLLNTSCTKEKTETSVLQETLSATSNSSSLSSTDEPALLLARSASLANTTYYVQTNRNKSAEYIAQNQFSQSVKIDTVKVYLFSASSTESIPTGGFRNFSLYIGGSQYGPTFGSPNIGGGANTFSLGSSGFILTTGSTQVFTVYSDFPLNTSFGFFTKMELKGVNTVTGQRVTTTTVIGQTISVVPEPAINPTFFPLASSLSQYVACGNGGNQYEITAAYKFNGLSNTYKIVELKYAIAENNSSIAAIKVGGVTFPFVANTAYVTGLNILVPQNGLVLDAKLWYPEVGALGLSSGTQSTVKLTSVTYLNLSSNILRTVNLDVPAVPMKLVGSKPAPQFNSLIHTGLVIGVENKIAEVTISADVHGNLSQNNILFTINSFGISNFSLSNARATDNSGSPFVGSSVSVGPNSESLNLHLPSYIIPAGTSKTFVFYAKVNGIGSTGAGIQSTLNPAGFVWTDDAGNGGYGAERGFLVYNFPLNSYLLIQ